MLDPLGIDVFHGPDTNSLIPGSDPVFSISDGSLNAQLATTNVLLATSSSQANYSSSTIPGANDDNITVEDGTAINTGANTLYFSTSILNLFSTIVGHVSGGVASPFAPAGITLKDPTTVNVFTGAATQASIQQGVDIVRLRRDGQCRRGHL